MTEKESKYLIEADARTAITIAALISYLAALAPSSRARMVRDIEQLVAGHDERVVQQAFQLIAAMIEAQISGALPILRLVRTDDDLSSDPTLQPPKKRTPLE